MDRGPFVLSTIYFGVRKGENNYYESDDYDGNEQRTKGLVIFGATGDLCKKKIIPALYNLWKKGLLPENFVITGTARREPTVEQWKQSLGDYPEKFFHHLDYVSTDLTNPETFTHLPDYLEDNTYFLSVFSRKI